MAELSAQNEELVKEIAGRISPEVANLVAQKMIERAKGERGALPAPVERPAHEKGIGLAQSLVLFAAGGGKVADQARLIAEAKRFGWADQEKALQEGSFSGGGMDVRPQYLEEFIELLRPANVLQKLGASFQSFKSEAILGKQDSGVSTFWIDEGEAPAKSAIGTSQLKLKAHKLGAAVDISKDILRNPDVAPGYEARVRNDMLEAARVAFETKGITGAGEKSPKGLLVLMDQTQKVARTGAGAAADQITDIDKLPRLIKQTERSVQSRGWLFDPIEEAKLLSLRDSAGWVFRDEMLLKNTLRGAHYETSTLTPAGVRVYGEWSDLIWGIDTAATIEQSDGARFLNDEVTVMLVMRGDYQVKRPKSFAATTGN